MADQTGRVTVKLDGDALRSKPGASIDIGGLASEEMMTDQGLFVAKQEWRPSIVECVIVHMGDTDLVALRNTKEITLTFHTDTGVTYTVANARIKNPPKLENGECPLTFVGSPAT